MGLQYSSTCLATVYTITVQYITAAYSLAREHSLCVYCFPCYSVPLLHTTETSINEDTLPPVSLEIHQTLLHTTETSINEDMLPPVSLEIHQTLLYTTETSINEDVLPPVSLEIHQTQDKLCHRHVFTSNIWQTNLYLPSQLQ